MPDAGVPERGGSEESFKVVATILGPDDDEEMEEAPMREGLAHHLAHRAVRDIREKATGRTVVGILDPRCDSTDEGIVRATNLDRPSAPSGEGAVTASASGPP
jgi:hypothetical protein